MKINPFIFRGYDLRGLVDKDLNDNIVECIGKAYGTFLSREGIKKAVVGRDCRTTSPQYSEAMIRGLEWAGIDIIDIGQNLIGTFYWAQYYLDCRGGVYVTASHNPANYNGFKIANDFSETLVSESIQKLRRMVEEDDYKKGEKQGKTEKKDVLQAYFSDLLKKVPLNKKFKIVIDPSCSTAGVIAPQLLKKAGCEVIENNCKIDPSFPCGTPDPTEMSLAQRLKDAVLEEGADVGFSYDADGDRIGIVDNKGTIIWNDVLVALFAIDVLDYHPGATIMYNSLCSKAVEETITKYGGKPFMWRTGHSFLKKKNQEIKAAFIGELSGHFFFSADFYNHDDGLYSTMRLLKYLGRTNQSLFEAVESLPKYISSPEIKIYCSDEGKTEVIKKISSVLKKDFQDSEVIDDERVSDGVRVNMPDSMFVIRYSQNAPVLTAKFEAKTKEQYDFLKNYIDKLFRSYKEIVWDAAENVNLEALH